LFDPPFGVKTFDESGLPLLEWTMVWINNSNTVAIHSFVSDAIPNGTRYVPGGASSGFPLPAGAPAGSTNTGVACTENSASTATSLCYYEGPTTDFPRGRIIWAGTLGPDPGVTSPANADDEITITFRLDVDESTNTVRNMATIDADLNADGDMTDPGEQQVATVSTTWRRSISKRLPSTGFAPGLMTDLSEVPGETYTQTGGITLEIPALKINVPVVGVPLRNGDWNVSWLGSQAGWLEGTAFPSWKGNSVITSHVYLSSGLPGPFVSLGKLRYGEVAIIHAYGQKYMFEVRSNEIVAPSDPSAFQHEERPWLTLVTCQEYDEQTNTYRKRVVVQAVLVRVTEE
jgi:LPXTG-site transpeptidase (sortase) family protein